MGTSLDALASYFRPQVDLFLADPDVVAMDLVVVDTDRTPTEQEQKLATGVSWTSYSKHEPQPPEGKSEAIDVCPRAYTVMKGWNPTGPLWDQLGAIGERYGMFWGGRWVHINNGRGDPGHFQYIHPSIQVLDVDQATQI